MESPKLDLFTADESQINSLARNVRKIRLEVSEDDAKLVAIKKLRNIILEAPLLTELGLTLLDEAGELESDTLINSSISDSFARKAASTLPGPLCQ